MFSGSLNFQADGSLASGTGTLTGASYGHTFGWIWGGSPTFGQSAGGDIGYTWLVDSTSSLGILIEWNYSNPNAILFLTSSNGVYDGPEINGRNIDRAVTTSVNQVPEPGSLAIIGLGLLGLLAARRRMPN